MRFFSGLMCSLWLLSGSVHAATELPEQWSFELAMQLVDEGNYYDLLFVQAEMESAQADLLGATGLNDFSIDLEALAQYVDPSVVTAQEINDDHKLSIVLRKTLLDFGYAEDKLDAAEAKIQSAGLMLKQIRLQKRIEVARKFFDINLADLQFTVDNEAISTAYIKYNKTLERNQLKMKSDVDLLEAEFEYQQVRARRYQSETMQRISRASFAESIAKPQNLPSEVIIPDLSFITNKRPEFEDLLKLAMANNLQLRAQQLLVESAARDLAASRNKGGSKLSTEVEWAEYSNETPTKNNWRASLKYSVPLYETDALKSERARANALLQQRKARLQQLESEIRHQLLVSWQQIYVLNARMETDKVAENYRELYQDRSRAYYEMEYRTDLGDSFVRVSEARLEKFKNRFELAIVWMKLAMLTGTTLEEFLKQ